jgi:hypothetical protein
MLAPATVVVGWVVNAKRVAGPTEMSNAALVTLVAPLLEATRV